MTRRLTPPRGVESEKRLSLFADVPGVVARSAGDDARDRAGAFNAFTGDLLFALAAEHEQLRGARPTAAAAGISDAATRCVPRQIQMPTWPLRLGSNPAPSPWMVPAGKDAPFGDEERSPFGLRVLGPDERRDELSGQVLGHIHREDDGLAVRFAPAASGCCACAGSTRAAASGASDGRATNERSDDFDNGFMICSPWQLTRSTCGRGRSSVWRPATPAGTHRTTTRDRRR